MKPTGIATLLMVALLPACNGIRGPEEPNAGLSTKVDAAPPSLQQTLQSVIEQLRAVHAGDDGQALGLYPAELELVFSVSATKQSGKGVDVAIVPLPIGAEFSTGETNVTGNTVKVVYRNLATLSPDAVNALTKMLEDDEIRGRILSSQVFSESDIDRLLETLATMP